MPEKRKAIADLVNQSFFEIAKAEALETQLWKRKRVTPKKYFETIQLKGGVAELQCRIGAIMGGADEKILTYAANYGRIIGILSTMNDEFIDMYDFYELQHRLKNELPPYPIICALQNDSLRKQILPIIEKAALSREDSKYLVKAVMNSKEVQNIRDQLKSLSEKEIKNNLLLKDIKKGKEAATLLQALALNL
jgi:geranylgeranyl pyrophosphate synthase